MPTKHTKDTKNNFFFFSYVSCVSWAKKSLTQMIQFTEKDDSIIFTVRVVPRASKSEIVGELDGALKVRIASPPVDGAANAELIKLLAKTFDVPKSAIEIIGGQTSKAKQIKITNIKSENFIAILRLEN